MKQSHDSKPAVSIVTPCYNGEQYIQDAIESVRQQKYENLEHIVVDGKSTDNTINILDRYPHLTVISEPDEGIYDALNKGLLMASGEYVGWLNADDVYTDSAFSAFMKAYRSEINPDLIAGSCEVFEGTQESDSVRARHEFTPPHRIKQGYIDHHGALLNGCLLSSGLLDRVGNFDASLDISADLDYLIRIAATAPDTMRIKDVVYRYRHHDDSITFNDNETFDTIRKTALIEGRQFMEKYMQDSTLPEPLRKYCQREYRARSGALLAGYLAHRQVWKALGTTAGTVRTDPIWPGWLLATLVRRSTSW